MTTRSLDDLIKRIYNPKYQSVWTCVLGPNQAGKTDFNLFQMERIEALGLAEGFGANMPLEADFEIDFITDFQTLKKRCQMLNPNPQAHGIKRYFFLGSEMGKWLPRDQAWLNVKFIEELQLVRKYGLNFLGDGIARIDERILNEKHFHGYFKKLSKSDPTRATYIDWFRGGKTYQLYNIPRTTIKFDTWYSANFYMEPQAEEGAIVPLNAEHKIVEKYLELGSWKKVGITTQEGKRAVMAVLKFHKQHCLHGLSEEPTSVESEIHKDSVEVTE